MGKARRLKEQRRRLGLTGPGDGRLIESEADLMADPGLLSSYMSARVTYLDDPVFGGMQAAVGIGADGRLVADGSGTEEPIPVVLFEPAKVMMSENKDTGLVQELRTEAIVAAGFHRMPPPGPLWAAKPAAGWEVRREQGALVPRAPRHQGPAEARPTARPVPPARLRSSPALAAVHGVARGAVQDLRGCGNQDLRKCKTAGCAGCAGARENPHTKDQRFISSGDPAHPAQDHFGFDWPTLFRMADFTGT